MSNQSPAIKRLRVGLVTLAVLFFVGVAGYSFLGMGLLDAVYMVIVIARGELQSTEKKLMQAGADRVVMPAAAGAGRMAAMITRPSTVELIELAAGRHMAEVEIDELVIPADCSLVGQTVRDVQPRARHGLLIVAVRNAGKPLVFNPDADFALQGDDAVMVMGRITDIERFRDEYEL